MFSFKFFVWLGDLSGNMFLIHQMVIRYVNGFANLMFSTSNTVAIQIVKIFISLFITITAALLWDKITQKEYVKTK